MFDIITPDLLSGPIAAGAEIIALANDCLNSFPNLAQNYDIHVSHSKSTLIMMPNSRWGLNVIAVVQLVMSRLPTGQRGAVIDIMGQAKTVQSQKRALLLKRGLLRSTADELELLAEIGKSAAVHLFSMLTSLQRTTLMGSFHAWKRYRPQSLL